MAPRQSKSGCTKRLFEEPEESLLPVPEAAATESDGATEELEDPEEEPLFHPVRSSNA